MRLAPVSIAEARAVASSEEVEEAAVAAAMPVGVAEEEAGAPAAMPEERVVEARVARPVAGEAAPAVVASPEALAAEPEPTGPPLRAATHRDNQEAGLPRLPLSPVRRRWGIRSGRVERRVRTADRSS